MLRACMRLGNKNYLKSNRIILPLIAYFAFFGIAYSVGPQKVLPSLVVQAIYLFVLMTVISVSYCDSEDEVLEQIMLMKVGPTRRSYLYISKIFVLTRIIVVFSLISTIYPFFRYYFGFSGLFDRAPVFNDAILGLLLNVIFSLLGMFVGLILNSTILPDRKFQICILVIVTILAIVQGQVIEDFPAFRIISFLLPPISSVAKQVNKQEYVSISAFWGLGKGVVYCCSYAACYLLLMCKPWRLYAITSTNKKDK
ncbi:hypothetical protein [Anaerosporobacter faecicola]|uniref:hypothetical protein n=1 Tax=Anaerosporobacter faecicola TaxID=2718714 RepID=UPI00143AD78F|nr:hypothetical protein [Anaerosporobacter faecicola]